MNQKTPFVPKANTGTMWPNERKTNSNQPDMRGDIFLDRTFLQDMIDKSDSDLVKIQISAWDKVIIGQNCLSLAASAPYVKPDAQSGGQQAGGYQRPGARQQPAPAPERDVPDEDIPF
jgi:hypothetical protein